MLNVLKKLAGPLGIGKSALLMQAVNYAMCKPWIVIYIPHGKDFIFFIFFIYNYLSILINSLVIMNLTSCSICK